MRGFIVTREAWYAEANPGLPEIGVGMYHPEGGGLGEFYFRWHRLGGQMAPRLEAYDDDWPVLVENFRDLLDALQGLFTGGGNVTPERLAEVLRGLGVQDLTARENPNP